MRFDQREVQQKVLSCLADGREVYRKVLIKEVVALFNLPEGELTDTRPDSLLNRLMSNVGSAITKLLNDGDLTLSEGKKLSLTRLKTIVVDEAKIEQFVLTAFARADGYVKEELLSRAERYFKTQKTETLSDDQALVDELQNVLNKLTASGVLRYCAGKYSPATANQPLTPIGACINDVRRTGDVENGLIKAINVLGGEFFEVYSVQLLKEYFRLCGYRVLKARVTGGSNDNGIDGILSVKSPLGFVENIYIQCKVRKSAEVTLNEVRQFAGAFYCEKATKGIFMTNNVYHPDAQQFFNKVKSNIIGIDKHQLVDLAKDCSVGVRVEDGKLVLDEAVFLNAPKSRR